MIRAVTVIVSLLACVACGAKAVAPARDVTDGMGRHVQVPEKPRRLVALTPSLTETVYSLGAGGDIVGITDHTDYPPEARNTPSVGGIVDPSIERIVALRPDLVLATLEANRIDTIEALQRLGIPVFVVRPEGLEGILEAVQHVGVALNRVSDARILVERLRTRLQAVTQRVQGLPKPRVFVMIWPDPVVTVGRHAFITEAIEAAGAICVTRDIPQQWPRVSLEEVVRRAPDTILLIKDGHPTLPISAFKTRPGWNRMRAVLENRFIEVDARVQHSSPVVFDALEELARILHPGAFQKP